MADLNGDGYRDMISGSWPGEISFFAGGKDNVFEPAVNLLDQSGQAVNVGQASSVGLHDWDGDGDQDLIVGIIEGEVKFVPNLGGNGVPRFGAAQNVNAGGVAIYMTSDAGPTVADWDGDGVDDLICGDSDGSVTFFRATGRDDRGRPILADGVTLIPSLSGRDRANTSSDEGDLEGKHITRPGMRSKVCVTDWNRDGRLDLLIGDFQSTTGPLPQLTDDDRAEQERLKALQAETMKQYSKLWGQLDGKLRERLGIARDAQMTPDQQEKWGELYDEVARDVDGFEAVAQEVQDLWPQLARFQAERREHGWVWVYLRKPDGETASISEQAKRITLSEPTAQRPVSAGMSVMPGSDGRIATVVVRAQVAPGWHVYSHVPADEPYIQTVLSLQLPQGAEAIGGWSLPADFVSPQSPTLRLWMGDLIFSRQVRLPESPPGMEPSQIGCSISYQCCDENSCLPPDSIDLVAPLFPGRKSR